MYNSLEIFFVSNCRGIREENRGVDAGLTLSTCKKDIEGGIIMSGKIYGKWSCRKNTNRQVKVIRYALIF